MRKYLLIIIAAVIATAVIAATTVSRNNPKASVKAKTHKCGMHCPKTMACY